MSDAEAEAVETQIWLEFAVKSSYVETETGRALYQTYHHILGKLVNMINYPSPWLITNKRTKQ